MTKELINQIQRQSRWLMLIVIVVVFCIAYLGTNHLNFIAPHYLPMTNFDKMIPFLPWTVFIYLSAFLMVGAAVLLFNKKEKDYGRGVFGIIFLLLLQGAVFVVFPTAYPRPLLPADVSWLSHMAYDLLTFIETSRDCFPSDHIAMTVFVSLVLWRRGRLLGGISFFWTILVAISTLTLKQHYIVDVFAGITVAAITYYWLFSSKKRYRIL